MTQNQTGFTRHRRYLVLLADDSEPDRLTLRRALQQNTTNLEVVREVENGQEAMDYLAGRGNYGDRLLHPFPDLLILDLKMPLVDGFEVLQWLRAQPFPSLKVAILADVLTQVERRQALSFGVQHFYRKTTNPEELSLAVKILERELADGR